eukprot:6194003-Pleurochrysis_carterae.AAC.2
MRGSAEQFQCVRSTAARRTPHATRASHVCETCRNARASSHRLLREEELDLGLVAGLRRQVEERRSAPRDAVDIYVRLREEQPQRLEVTVLERELERRPVGRVGQVEPRVCREEERGRLELAALRREEQRRRPLPARTQINRMTEAGLVAGSVRIGKAWRWRKGCGGNCFSAVRGVVRKRGGRRTEAESGRCFRERAYMVKNLNVDKRQGIKAEGQHVSRLARDRRSRQVRPHVLKAQWAIPRSHCRNMLDRPMVCLDPGRV